MKRPSEYSKRLEQEAVMNSPPSLDATILEYASEQAERLNAAKKPKLAWGWGHYSGLATSCVVLITIWFVMNVNQLPEPMTEALMTEELAIEELINETSLNAHASSLSSDRFAAEQLLTEQLLADHVSAKQVSAKQVSAKQAPAKQASSERHAGKQLIRQRAKKRSLAEVASVAPMPPKSVVDHLAVVAVDIDMPPANSDDPQMSDNMQNLLVEETQIEVAYRQVNITAASRLSARGGMVTPALTEEIKIEESLEAIIETLERLGPAEAMAEYADLLKHCQQCKLPDKLHQALRDILGETELAAQLQSLPARVEKPQTN